MPFYYDVTRVTASHATPATELSHLWAKTVANQQPVAIAAVHVCARMATAGGGVLRGKTNSSTLASGGTAQTPGLAHPLQRAADSIWANDATAITPGASLTLRLSVGFAQAGGMNSWVAMEPPARLQMMANGANPNDIEFTSVTVTASVPIEARVDFAEGA